MTRSTQTTFMRRSSLLTLAIACLLCGGTALGDEPPVDAADAGAAADGYVVALDAFNDDLAVIEHDRIVLHETILFHFNETRIKKASWPLLDRVADLIKATPELSLIRIEGHTDSVGSRRVNRWLSGERAETVRDFLVERGIDRDRFTTEGFGEARPAVPNSSYDNRKLNRRVELIFVNADWDGPPAVPAELEMVWMSPSGVVRIQGGPDESTLASTRERIQQDALLETNARTRVTLRSEGLGRVHVEPSTRLKVVRLEHDDGSGHRNAIKLRRGAIEVVDRARDQTAVFTSEVSVVLRGAHARVDFSDETGLRVALYDGEAELTIGSESRKLRTGHAYHADANGGRIEGLGELESAPSTVRPTHGPVTFSDTLFVEREDHGSGDVILECARDPQFAFATRRVTLTGDDERVSLETCAESLGTSGELYARTRSSNDVGHGGALLGPPSAVFQYDWRATEVVSADRAARRAR